MADVEKRQSENYAINYEDLRKGIVKETPKGGRCNIKAMSRVEKFLGMTQKELLSKCSHDDQFTKLLAFATATIASRQGNVDEKHILDYINETFAKPNGYKRISTHPTGNNSYHCMDDGSIQKGDQSRKEKKNRIKSIDGIFVRDLIPDIISSFPCITHCIFHKNIKSVGGHQDNVLNEVIHFCDWCKTALRDKKYIVLVEGAGKTRDTILGLQKDYQDFVDICTIDGVGRNFECPTKEF